LGYTSSVMLNLFQHLSEIKKILKQVQDDSKIMLLNSLKLYFRNIFNILVLAISLIANIFCWLWLALQINSSTDILFLHYNILFGVDYIDSWWKMYFLPLAGLLIILFNTFLGWWLWDRDRLMSIILHSVTLLCQLFLVIACILLVFLNV